MNEGGINPYADRHWWPEPSESDDDAAASDISDFSVWKDKTTDDLEDIDHDVNGPEYNSDYDTDPDLDSEGMLDSSETDE